MCVLLFGLYLLDAVRLTLFPIPILTAPAGLASIFRRINLVPLNFGGLFGLSPGVIYQNLVGNLLLTLPFGFGIHFILKTEKRFSAKKFLWIAFLPGLAVELAQLAVSLAVGVGYRGIDINDVLLNTAGAWMGFGFFHIFSMLCRMILGRFNPGPGGLLAYIYRVAVR